MTCQIWSKNILCVGACVLVYCEWECVCMCVSYSPDIWSLLNCSTSSSLSCAVSVSGETTLSTTHDRPFRAEGERERDKEGYTQLTQHTQNTHTYTHTNKQTDTHTYTHKQTLAYTHAHMQKHTQHTHINKQTHTHTHTPKTAIQLPHSSFKPQHSTSQGRCYSTYPVI